MEDKMYVLDDAWYTSDEIRTKYRLQYHDLVNLIKNNILESKEYGGKGKLYHIINGEWPYDFKFNDEKLILYKVRHDYKKGILTNHSHKIMFYLSHNPVINEYCEEKLKKEPLFATIGKTLLAIADPDKYVKYCAVCGKIIPARNDGSNGKSGKERVFCSRECAFTAEGIKVQVERFKAANPINPFCREDVKEKIKKTNLERYGFENPGANPEIMEKRRQTLLERYGVENYYALQNCEGSVIETNYKNSFERLKNLLESRDISILFSFDDYRKWRDDISKNYEFKCNKCGLVFTKKLYYHRNKFCCPHCNKRGSGSIEERDFFEMIKSLYDGKILTNTKGVIPPYELDIYIPDKNVAIEFNGLYWHCDSVKKDKNYHLNKTNMCHDKNIKLIHVFEDEWFYKSHIVLARIKNILGLTKYKIQARKCVVKEIDSETADKFVEKYHLQGSAFASKRLGLFYKNRLVAVMTFAKPRFNDHFDWELLRYCTVANFNVIGRGWKVIDSF